MAWVRGRPIAQSSPLGRRGWLSIPPTPKLMGIYNLKGGGVASAMPLLLTSCPQYYRQPGVMFARGHIQFKVQGGRGGN